MNAIPLALALLLSGADDLSPAQHGALRLKVPAAWKHSQSQDSHQYVAPSEDAQFELSIFRVDPRRDGKVCLDQLLKALGDQGWERVSVGAAPAARKISTDVQVPSSQGEQDEERASDSAEPIEVQTHQYVGCNGSTKWLLSMTMHAKKKKRFDPLAKKIISSIQYVK